MKPDVMKPDVMTPNVMNRDVMTQTPAYREPLSRRAKIGVFASVIFFHVGIGWALASVQPQARKPRYAPLSPPSCLVEASSPPRTRRVVHNGLVSFMR